MHIHGNSLAIHAANFYAASHGEKAAEARRTAEVRRKLLKSATEIDGAATPEETLMIGQWLDARHSQTQSEDEYRSAASGRLSEFG
ncbi:MAG: hypothetical protein WCA21_06060 [Terracidiphilus sp.]|jgi:hypothetical protein